jgi:MoaA/NifB/PqqE/SkfB family radical SAM enzyme
METVRWPVIKTIVRAPGVLRARPALGLHLLRYMRSFPVRRFGDNEVLHSHLPPLNSPAYRRFVDEHLLGGCTGPSHAQVGLTAACPQSCGYCYNRSRTGTQLTTAEILDIVRELKRLGVFWLGWTGGEPLLNRDIVRITAEASEGCAVKLFTTGTTLTPALARDLQRAGLFSVCVSLDHWTPEVHDANRGVKGAWQTALAAIAIFLDVPGLHVGVSSVISRQMIRNGETERLLSFFQGLGVHEVWLSETKPSVEAFWADEHVITEDDRLRLARLQDEVNARRGPFTLNYLGHFEGAENFGCNAGRKMAYVDAFGEVSPCVFTPMTLGNVRDRPLGSILADMARCFPGEGRCFVNRNYRLLQQAAQGRIPLSREATLRLLQDVRFGPRSRFQELLK